MNNKINWKRIIFATLIMTLIIVSIEFFLEPTSYIRSDYFNKLYEKMVVSQHIAPERLFVNTWRVIRNSYIDESLNGQNWAYWRLRYSGKIKTVEDANVAINSMIASLNDPYSKFLLSDSFAKQKMVLDSKVTGIGVLFGKSGDDVVINHVLANSSAHSANIQAGDTIVNINGRDTKNIEMDKIVSEIVGGKNDKVTITVKRNNVLITKEIVKKDIFLPTMEYKITKDNIGIITLASVMGEKAVEDFENIIIKTNDTKGIVLDLRNNYGGTLFNTIQMANFMMDEDEILRVESRINNEYRIYSEEEKLFKQKPVVILVNSKTASASEIFAGTLQINIGAIVIGENTFGKNTIQQVIPMSNGAGIIITTDKYILPDERDIYNVGLNPDIEYSEKDLPKDRDFLLDEAQRLINQVVENKK